MLATIERYGLIAAAVVCMALAVFAGWQWEENKVIRGKLDAANGAVTQLQQGLAQLQQGQKASDDAIVAMQQSQAVVTQHASTVRARVVTMGNANADIQKWLDSPVPGHGCLLDDTCAPAGAVSPAIGGASAAVR